MSSSDETTTVLTDEELTILLLVSIVSLFLHVTIVHFAWNFVIADIFKLKNISIGQTFVIVIAISFLSTGRLLPYPRSFSATSSSVPMGATTQSTKTDLSKYHDLPVD